MEERSWMIHILHWLAMGLETVGVAVIVGGAIMATVLFGRGRPSANVGRRIP